MAIQRTHAQPRPARFFTPACEIETPAEKWQLASSYPLVSPDCAKVRSVLAKKIGLGRKAAAMKAGGRRRAVPDHQESELISLSNAT